jgi:hypothetical protein
MTLESGATLGRYRIERRLGAGAMGEVYLAQDPHIERQLAVKTVRIGDADVAEIEDRKVRLLREAKAAGRLVHPHVVTLFDAGETGGVFYLAFEYVAGPDLAGRQRLAPPLTLGEVLRIGRQAAEGLDAAHRQGIVHRDIKPSNILLDAHGQVKISDFGIAKMLGQGTELTQTGSVVGSPHYLSPEQIRGEELDGRSDLFSLGVVLYELLTRHRPFEGDTITTLVYQILAREPNPIAGLRPGLPERVEKTVVRMLAKDRDARFATAREVVDEIAACERELSKAMLDSPAAALPEELEETARLPSPPPTPKPTPAPPWSMPMPPPPADATAPTRLSPRAVATGGGSGGAAVVAGGSGSGPGGAAIAPTAAIPPPPLPPAGPAAAPRVAAAPAAAAPGRFPWVIVVVLLVIGLLTVVGGVGAYFWLRGGWGKTAVAENAPPVAPAAAVEPASTSPAAVPAATHEVAPQSSYPASEPSPAQVVPPPAAPVPAPERTPLPAATLARPSPTKAVPPPRATVAPAPAPTVAETPRREPPVRVAPAPPPAPAPAPTEAEPAEPGQRYDREMASTLALKFRVEPDEAVVSFKEEGDRRFTVIGRAGDYDADKKKLPSFDLPGAGTYYLRIYHEGREVIYKLDAQPGPQPTTIAYVLVPKAGRRN